MRKLNLNCNFSVWKVVREIIHHQFVNEAEEEIKRMGNVCIKEMLMEKNGLDRAKRGEKDKHMVTGIYISFVEGKKETKQRASSLPLKNTDQSSSIDWKCPDFTYKSKRRKYILFSVHGATHCFCKKEPFSSVFLLRQHLCRLCRVGTSLAVVLGSHASEFRHNVRKCSL